MLSMQMPQLRQLICPKEVDKKDTFIGDSACLFTHGSGISIKKICEFTKKVLNQKKITVFLPGFFCQETLNIIGLDSKEVIFYELDDNFNPNWEDIKAKAFEQKPDIFIHCHFFGVFHDPNRSRNFCNQNGILMIEDCAHVLPFEREFGKKGDIAVFSPHKVLPIPDGGLLVINDSKLEYFEELKKNLHCYFDGEDNSSCVKWRIKKLIQKIIRKEHKCNYDKNVHYGEIEDVCSPYKITKYSKKILLSYPEKLIKEYGYIRRENLKLMNFYFKEISEKIKILVTDENICPYFAAYSLEEMTTKEIDNLIAILNKKNIPTTYWPTLPVDLKDMSGFMKEKKWSQNILVVPIHQGIKCLEIIKMMSTKKSKLPNIKLEWIASEDKNIYDNCYAECEKINIPQCWEYGEIKSETDNWVVRRAKIFDEDRKIVGVVQVLLKQKLRINLCARLNRGPMFFKPYANQIEYHLSVLKQLKRELHCPISSALNIDYNVENLIFIMKNRWKRLGSHGFGSGIINLSEMSEQELRASLNSKWRNQLLSAEKKNVEIRNDVKYFDDILDIYESDQNNKGYRGVPREILKKLKDKNLIEVKYIMIDDEIAAFDIFYVSDNLGLYLVGWNGSKGRKIYANNLLLYSEAIELKKKNLKIMDLGGIDYIETPENARFKDGMNPIHYQLIGEFIKL